MAGEAVFTVAEAADSMVEVVAAFAAAASAAAVPTEARTVAEDFHPVVSVAARTVAEDSRRAASVAVHIAAPDLAADRFQAWLAGALAPAVDLAAQVALQGLAMRSPTAIGTRLEMAAAR
ncbi:MAG TPA: hypothetical protein VMD77_01125 [Candidatus Baltobacteraceae bacterium]|nr:hypothetical protein [Candidatus Baltobacteraceae bacterium]